MGWRPLEGSVTHAGRIDTYGDRNHYRQYLVLLLHWRDRPIVGMKSNQPIAYYVCLQRGFAVDPDKGNLFYKRLLDGLDPAALAEATDTAGASWEIYLKVRLDLWMGGGQ